MNVGSLPEDRDPFLRLGLSLKFDRMLDLGKLVIDKRVVAITVTVILNQEVKRLLLSTFPEHKSRGVGHKVNGDEKVHRWTDLEDIRKTPLPRGSHVAATEVDPGVDDRTENPVGILRVSD